MTLNTYDSTKHHIGLKIKGGATNYGFMLNGNYRMEMQREALGAQDFGGSTDLIGQTPGLARWTQDDFSGGMGQYSWGKDDAMFADSINFMPDMQSRRLLSVPPMYLKYAFDPDTKTGWVKDRPLNMWVLGGYIYTVFGHGILRQAISDGTQVWTGRTDMLADATETIVYAEYDPLDNRIVILVSDSSAGVGCRIHYRNTALTDPTNISDAGPTGVQEGYGMAIFGKNLIIQVGNKTWLGSWPSDTVTNAGSVITWTELESRIPGRWKAHIEYNGQVYILSNDGGDQPTFRAHLSSYDGDGIVPITTFPHSFMAKCVEQYGGRIYVGGTGTDVNGGEHYAELYEVLGNSLRMVRSFSPETRRNYISAGEWPNQIDDMTVHEGLLWFAQKGSRMVAYDQTADAFHGGPALPTSTLNFERIISGRGRLWGFGTDSADDTKHGLYRVAQPADGVTTSPTWEPRIDTCDFVYEPGVKKRWSEIKIMTRYGPVSTLKYSLDAGRTWTSLTITNTSTYYPVYWCTASLVGVTATENIRFRITLDTDTPDDAVTYHRELVAFTVSYAFLDTGKRAWTLSINGAETVETRDAQFNEAVTQTQDTGDIDAAFDDWAFNKQPLTYTDVDGATYDVSMVAYTRSKPIIGPNPSGETHSESHHICTLLQV